MINRLVDDIGFDCSKIHDSLTRYQTIQTFETVYIMHSIKGQRGVFRSSREGGILLFNTALLNKKLNL